MPYKIVFDRKACIGSAVCNAMGPEDWLLVEDGKSILLDSKQVDENTFERDFEDKELNNQLVVAHGCPPNAIHIVDKATGKRLI